MFEWQKWEKKPQTVVIEFVSSNIIWMNFRNCGGYENAVSTYVYANVVYAVCARVSVDLCVSYSPMKLVILASDSDFDYVLHRMPTRKCVEWIFPSWNHGPFHMDVRALRGVWVMYIVQAQHPFHCVIWRTLFILIYWRTTCKWIRIAYVSRIHIRMLSCRISGKIYCPTKINRISNGLIRFIVIIWFLCGRLHRRTYFLLQVRALSRFACAQWNILHVSLRHVISLRIAWILHPCDYTFTSTLTMLYSKSTCTYPKTKLPLDVVANLSLGSARTLCVFASPIAVHTRAAHAHRPHWQCLTRNGWMHFIFGPYKAHQT